MRENKLSLIRENGVEILMRYRDMERPKGLGIDGVAREAVDVRRETDGTDKLEKLTDVRKKDRSAAHDPGQSHKRHGPAGLGVDGT